MSRFVVHFDGPITTDHKVSLRVLSKTYEHMQRSIDRSYLVVKYGSVWKYARLKKEDYLETDFLASYPTEGGIILEACKKGAHDIIDKIANTLIEPFNTALSSGEELKISLDADLAHRKSYLSAKNGDVKRYEEITQGTENPYQRAYANRSILKEIDQLVGQISTEDNDGSYVELKLHGTKSHPIYTFNKEQAESFHRVIAKRELGEPYILPVSVRLLDKGNNFQDAKAKILNLLTSKEQILHLASQKDFELLHPHHTDKFVLIAACPIVEYGSFDPYGGDLFFLDIIQAK